MLTYWPRYASNVFTARFLGRILTLLPGSGARRLQECARPRAQQRGKHGVAVIFLRTQKIPGLLRPGTAALRQQQCQDAPGFCGHAFGRLVSFRDKSRCPGSRAESRGRWTRTGNLLDRFPRHRRNGCGATFTFCRRSRAGWTAPPGGWPGRRGESFPARNPISCWAGNSW